MKSNLSLYQKILFWAIGIVFAILLITGAGTTLAVRTWLISDISRMIESESIDVMRSITIRNDSLIVVSTVEWEEHHHQSDSEIPIYIQIRDNSRTIFYPLKPDVTLDIPESVQFSTVEALITHATVNGISYRFITRPITHSGTNYGWVVVFMSSERVAKATKTMALLYIAGFSVLMFLVVLITRYGVRQALDSIQAISIKARNIQAKTLADRIPLPSSKDEVYHLAVTLNAMLDRIENSLIATRRFFNNASHEIKTPLAIIVAQLEKLKAKTEAIEKQDLDLLDYEINRITKIIDDLGIISKADYTGTKLKMDTLWLNDLVFDEILRFKPRAEQKSVSIIIPEIPSMTLKGDENWIRIMLSNLLDNAVKFSPKGSTIRIAFLQKGKSCRLSISDEGPGVPEEDLSLITRRFFRSENAKASSGSGLGLSIAEWVAENHGSTLHFRNLEEGGLEVTWEFPVND